MVWELLAAMCFLMGIQKPHTHGKDKITIRQNYRTQINELHLVYKAFNKPINKKKIVF